MIRQIKKYDQDGLFEISEASNGEEGWEFCEKYKPELVLTDIRMPKMDGIQLLQEIRNNELEIKVIILSAYSDFEYARSAIVNGASDYLLKPIDDTALTECLNKFVTQHKIERKEALLSRKYMATQYILNSIQESKYSGFIEKNMFERDIYTIHSTYREDMHIKGFQFGKGEKSACIVGAARGNEIQQMYICSQLVKTLRELENNGCISAGKQILVIPTINAYSVNISRRFFGVKEADINRSFPGNDYGEPADRLTNALLTEIKDYVYGIQFTSFYRPGEFVPHVRMMETGYQNTSLANLFGLPYVVVRKPVPIDTKTLNYNWQDEMTAAFSVYTNQNSQIDEASARQAVAAVLRFLKRMGLIRYESHSGYISHVLYEKDLSDVHTNRAGIFRGKVHAGDDVRYGNEMAEIIDPYDGSVRETILAPTDGIVFFAHTEALISEKDIAYRLIHRLHE